MKNKKILRNITILLIVIILFLIIIGLRIFVFMSTMLFNYSNENTIKNETSEIRKNEVYFTAKEIFESIISKDAEKLKSFFKPSIKNKEIINTQIEEMLKFIDGNIVSYSDIKEGGGSKSKEYVTTVFEENSYIVKDIKTDAGRTYTITYNIVEIDKDNSKDIGMDFIGIFDNDVYDSNDGYSYSGKYIISEEEVDIVETSNSKHIPRKFFDAVLNKDKEALKDFLIRDLQELEETNIQINKFFEFIDGEIESYSEPRSEIRIDTNNYRVFEGIVSNIKTNTGKNYEIEYEYIDGLGIYEIILMNSDVYDKRKGEPISARIYVGDIFYLFNNNL